MEFSQKNGQKLTLRLTQLPAVVLRLTVCLDSRQKFVLFPRAILCCCNLLCAVFFLCVEVQTSWRFYAKKTRNFPKHKLMALLRFICGIFMCRSAKQVAYSSAKSFALQCKQIDVFMQKTRYFPKHKLMALQSFVRMFVLYLDAKQVTVSSVKSFALKCKQVDVFM